MTLEPSFRFLEVAYPYVARRLLTDEDPALRARLIAVRPPPIAPNQGREGHTFCTCPYPSRAARDCTVHSAPQCRLLGHIDLVTPRILFPTPFPPQLPRSTKIPAYPFTSEWCLCYAGLCPPSIMRCSLLYECRLNRPLTPLLQVLFHEGKFQWKRLRNLIALAKEGTGGLDLSDTVSDGVRVMLLDTQLRNQLLSALTEDNRLHIKVCVTVRSCITQFIQGFHHVV